MTAQGQHLPDCERFPTGWLCNSECPTVWTADDAGVAPEQAAVAAVLAEWYNGNLAEDCRDRLLDALAANLPALADVWDEAAEATADWMANNPGPSGIPRDPPRNPYESSRPTRLSNREGEEDGKNIGVRPDRPGQVAEGLDRRGLHVGSGVLAGSGSREARGCADEDDRRLTDVCGGEVHARPRTPANLPADDGARAAGEREWADDGIFRAAIEHAIECYSGPADDTVPVLRRILAEQGAATHKCRWGRVGLPVCQPGIRGERWWCEPCNDRADNLAADQHADEAGL